jgi:hypothetical protein
MSLPADVARCPGVKADGDWREGCEDCQRRTDRTGLQSWHVMPPKIIVFECEYRIPPETTQPGG